MIQEAYYLLEIKYQSLEAIAVMGLGQYIIFNMTIMVFGKLSLKNGCLTILNPLV